MKKLIISFLILVPFLPTYPFILDEKLSDYKLEKRATDLFKIVKCPICSGESLYESQSQLAYDMRKDIRERIKSGEDDEEIISDLKHIYGDHIMNMLPFNPVLWILPILVLFFGISIVMAFHCRK